MFNKKIIIIKQIILRNSLNLSKMQKLQKEFRKFVVICLYPLLYEIYFKTQEQNQCKQYEKVANYV